jgi:sulfite exporter TauE/SafE/copper chaperone CopZ
VLIEDILSEQPGITRVDVDLSKRLVTIEGDLANDREKVAAELSQLIAPHNYALSTEKQYEAREYTTMLLALPVGAVILLLFYLLQRSGILNLGFTGGLTPITALMVGVIASLSSCLAIVGGLVLSLSANISKDVSSVRPFFFFHVGRLSGFAFLGGVLGFIGASLSINPSITTMLGILAAVVMIMLGINLLDILHLTKRFQLVLPRMAFDRLTKIENGFFAPLLIGIGTFFLPCGFTQAMQVASLSSGSFFGGMTIMGMFALGTLPMLALLSFGSFRFAQSQYAPLFFKSAGVVVIGLGIFSLLASLASLGIINPLFNF